MSTEIHITTNVTGSVGPYLSKNIITEHSSDTDNPHKVTKAQVGLGNADNTADLDKPVSSATQSALDNKQNTLTPGNGIEITENTIGIKDEFNHFELLGTVEVTDEDIINAGDDGVQALAIDAGKNLENYKELVIKVFVPKNTLNADNGAVYFALGDSLENLFTDKNMLLRVVSASIHSIYFNYPNYITLECVFDENGAPLYANMFKNYVGGKSYPSASYGVSASDVDSINARSVIGFKDFLGKFKFPAKTTMTVYGRK